MARGRLAMRKVKKVLAFHFDEGRSAIATHCGLARRSVAQTLERFAASGLSWPEARDLDEEVLEAEPETRRSFEGRRPGGAIVTHGESDDPDLRLRPKPSEMSTRESGARRPLQRGRRPELQNLGGLDPDRFARLRIAALARPALGDGEGTEVADGVAAFLLPISSARSRSRPIPSRPCAWTRPCSCCLSWRRSQ